MDDKINNQIKKTFEHFEKEMGHLLSETESEIANEFDGLLDVRDMLWETLEMMESIHSKPGESLIVFLNSKIQNWWMNQKVVREKEKIYKKIDGLSAERIRELYDKMRT